MSTLPSHSYAAVLTTYNAAKTIDRALDGILNQTVLPREIIIVDDCSRDETVEIIKKYSSNHASLQLHINKSNMGQSWARNFAITQADSEFIIIFDDDDFSHPGRAAEHMSMFNLGSKLNFVSSVKIYANGRSVNLKNQSAYLTSLDGRQALLSTLRGGPLAGFSSLAIPASTSAFSKSEFLRIGGYDENLRRLEDADLFIRMAENAAEISWSESELVSRYATYSPIKGGSIEMDHEFKILLKFKELLDSDEFMEVRALIELRALYFQHRYIQAICEIITQPAKRKILQTKFKSVYARIIHDLKGARKA